jgi:ArsR family transcriptional regulator, lead/cadmium/zinc/bismuth-responsive transcriptional repressor
MLIRSGPAVSDDRCDLLCLDLPKAERLRATRLAEPEAARLAERAKAFGDATRLTLAAALAETDELCVCDLAWVAERAENLVSHHLRALRNAELVSSRRDGKMVMYSLTAEGRALLSVLAGEVEVPE